VVTSIKCHSTALKHKEITRYSIVARKTSPYFKRAFQEKLITSRETDGECFENRVLRRIFGLKGYEVTGGWKKSHNDKPHFSAVHRMLRCYNDQMKDDEMIRHAALEGD
jgi:hypothetical protein